MENFKIILFLCNWNPHAAFLALQEKENKIPPEINMIRIPCSGRIDKALLFKAFEMGADGVALVGCKTGTCRYGPGPATAIENTDDTKKILDLIGIGGERIINETFLPHESEEFGDFLEKFCNDIKKLGKSPIKPGIETAANNLSIKDIAYLHNIYSCLDCGKCTSSCPLALIGKEYSPRSIAYSVIEGNIESKIEDIHSCLTCGICSERCPSAVDFPNFIKDLRIALAQGQKHQAHRGFFQSLMRAMTSENLQPRHWKDLSDKVETDKDSKTLFFGGCAPYFDVFFKNKPETFKILTDSLKILNFFDMKPNTIDEEICCGHDLLWSGDKDNFIKLAKLNVKRIQESGAERLITSCPECFKTIKYDYPAYGIETGFEVMHIYEFIDKQIEKGSIKFKKLRKKITYQDSCRLIRLDDKVSEMPRKLINHLQIDGFTEMQDYGKSSLCCGNCAWTGCSSYTKSLQVKRLRQAKETGSDLLLTSCPKCMIHLSCAQEDPFIGSSIDIEMADLNSVILKTISYE